MYEIYGLKDLRKEETILLQSYLHKKILNKEGSKQWSVVKWFSKI